MANLEFKYLNGKKYLDIYATNGSLAITKGLWSQVQMSLLNDKRANNSQVVIKKIQRGWLGNQVIGNIPEYEIGSWLWLEIEQNSITENGLKNIERYSQDSLKWLKDDKYLQDVKTEVSSNTNGVVFLDITLIINQNNIQKKRLNLWLTTFKNAT